MASAAVGCKPVVTPVSSEDREHDPHRVASVRPLLHFDRNGLWGDVITPREDQVPLLVNPVQYGVDRIEDGGWVVLEDGDARTFTVSRGWLPADVREGDVVSVT